MSNYSSALCQKLFTLLCNFCWFKKNCGHLLPISVHNVNNLLFGKGPWTNRYMLKLNGLFLWMKDGMNTIHETTCHTWKLSTLTISSFSQILNVPSPSEGSFVLSSNCWSCKCCTDFKDTVHWIFSALAHKQYHLLQFCPNRTLEYNYY